MPLTDLQRAVLKVVKPFREQHDFVAGGAALNWAWLRLSDDLDIFHDARDRLPDQVEGELQALRDAGFGVEVTTRDRSTVEAIVRLYGFETRIQWLDDPETSFRFFPAQLDDEFGFKLHPADLAVNKVLAASRRREARDAVDIVNIARLYAPLGPLVWAAAGKDEAVGPMGFIRNLRDRAFGFSDDEIRTVRMDGGDGMTRQELRAVLGPAIDTAFVYCEEIAPPDRVGQLFVDSNDRPVAADAEALARGLARAIPLKRFSPTAKVSGT